MLRVTLSNWFLFLQVKLPKLNTAEFLSVSCEISDSYKVQNLY